MTDIVQHTPVLLQEVMDQLAPQPGQWLLDATLGHGGHAEAYLERTKPDGRVVGLDADPDAAAIARKRLESYGDHVTILNNNFANLKDSILGGGILQRGSTLTQEPPSEILPVHQNINEGGFDHILFDLGIGSHQLADERRGFSFSGSTSLSMRYGAEDRLPAAQLDSLNKLERRLQRLPDVPEILSYLSVPEIAEILRVYGEERYALAIARAVKEAQPATAEALAAAVSAAVPSRYRAGRINPATRTFMALRLAVNRELEVLQAALPQAVELTRLGGRIAVISFHSLEDRIVKRFFREKVKGCICPPDYPVCQCGKKPSLKLVNKKPLMATEDEQRSNPRARSAKLRVAEKIETG